MRQASGNEKGQGKILGLWLLLYNYLFYRRLCIRCIIAAWPVMEITERIDGVSRYCERCGIPFFRLVISVVIAEQNSEIKCDPYCLFRRFFMNDILTMQAAMSGNPEAQKRFFGDAPRLEYPEHTPAPVKIVGGIRSQNGKLLCQGDSEIKVSFIETEIHSHKQSPLLKNGEIDEEEFERRMLAATQKERGK